MKVVCDRAALVEALSLAGSVVPNRTTAPVLGCLSLTAEDGILTVASTNAEVGISIGVTQVEVSAPGKALVPADKLKNVLRHYMQPVHWEQRNRTTKWVTLRWPTPAMAQRAGMSTEAFEEFFFSTCLVDYVKMAMVMEPLVHLMQQTDRVQVVGPGLTDLTFSIKGMAPHKDAGQHNVPDGEVATAPIIDSANGVIQFNVPTVYYNATFDNVLLELVDGNVVRAESDRSLVLDEMLDQDDGAKRLGEFAFGVNPRITQPIRDILFDEKMAGSIHLALGNAYPRCDNGNRSAIHWDLILSQTPEFGGGEIYFDGTLIRKDGLFVPPELMGLNPENLC